MSFFCSRCQGIISLMKKKMSSDCTQQHVSKQTRSGRKSKCIFFVWISMIWKGPCSYIYYSSVFLWHLNDFLFCNYKFQNQIKCLSTYSIGVTLLPLTLSFFSFKHCTSVSSRHSKFLSIFLLIIWFFQTRLLKFSEKLKRYVQN